MALAEDDHVIEALLACAPTARRALLEAVN